MQNRAQRRQCMRLNAPEPAPEPLGAYQLRTLEIGGVRLNELSNEIFLSLIVNGIPFFFQMPEKDAIDVMSDGMIKLHAELLKRATELANAE